MEHTSDVADDGTTKTTEEAASSATTSYLQNCHDVPDALPAGWVVRFSRSQPGYRYFFQQDSGVCQWELPVVTATAAATRASSESGTHRLGLDTDGLLSAAASGPPPPHAPSSAAPAAAPAPSGILKRRSAYVEAGSSSAAAAPAPSSSRKRSRGGKDPKEVRVLHLLKKHRGSRRPSSWRNKHITLSQEEAVEELRELVSILQEVRAEDQKELRATFEELAKTESDCSSSKRGGDLGFFGRKKMQPAFEKASFALKVGQLSEIVETSSGVHVILRLG